MKSLDDYSRDNAITMLLDRPRHRSFDQIWKDWAQDQRRLGHAEVSVDELRWVMEDAIERAPITDAQKSALHTLLLDELTQKHGLGPAAKLDLPYSNIPALKPGPERAALTARIAAEQKSRAPSRAASAAREGPHREHDRDLRPARDVSRTIREQGSCAGLPSGDRETEATAEEIATPRRGDGPERHVGEPGGFSTAGGAVAPRLHDPPAGRRHDEPRAQEPFTHGVSRTGVAAHRVQGVAVVDELAAVVPARRRGELGRLHAAART